MADTPPPPPEGFEIDPLATINGWGVTVTNGFRTPADTMRLRRAGYKPAENSKHLDDDAVDLTPGKSGRSMRQLHAEASRMAEQWGSGAKAIHEGDHVHLQLPGWGRAPGMPPPPPGFKPAGDAPLTGEAHDGDTVALGDGRNGRLFGYDAYELTQQGRRPDNSLVPLGRDARDFMQSEAQGAQVTATGKASYGRPVVTLDNDGEDPAQNALRHGYGLAAPEYLKGSPQFGDYMEAERLARLNRLGGHGTNAETPSQFRHKDGPWQGAEPPDGKTSEALFFDDPTPFEGLRPDIAKQYQALFSDPKSKPGDMIAFAKANGFQVRADDVRDRYKVRDKAFAKNPHAALDLTIRQYQPPRPVIDPGDGAFGSFARGLGDPMNAIDELGGVADAVGLTPGRENVWNSERRFGDVLWNNIDQNRAVLAHDDEEHPVARIAGQLTSGVALPMGATTTPLRLGATMAVEGGIAGAMAGEGRVVDRIPNAVMGTITGAALGPVLGHAGQAVAPALGRLLGKRAVAESGAEIASAAAYEAAPTVVARGQPQVRAAMAAEPGEELVGPVLGRERDYINIPPPPPGFEPVLGGAKRMDERLSPEGMARLAEGVDPAGAVPRPANLIESSEEAVAANAGRFEELKAPDEHATLAVNSVRPANGYPGTRIKIRGPFDITKTLRRAGGVKDSGGDLASAGISNAPRTGLDFGGNEQFLGKLIDNERGMSLDDAAEFLHERGYFPERPSINEVIDALHGEHVGDSVYLPEALPHVAEFESARAERHRIERAAQDGSPLVEDRGHVITLDDLEANRPPPSAYEDMPRMTGRVGNINLDRLEKPGEVAALLDQISKRVGGFSAAARGKVTHEETQRLAQEMGVKPEQLLKRQQGQALNAEQLYASRALVQRSRESVARLAKRAVGGSDEDLATFRKAWLKHAAIEEQISGATAEAGRALSQFRMLARAEDAGADAVRSYLKGAGGKESIQDAAEAIVDLMEDPAKASHFMREAIKPRWRDKFNELWVNSLLSGPRTHVVNFVGNALTTALSFPELATTAAIGKLTRSTDRALFGEIGARAAGLADSSIEALGNMRAAFKTGEPLDASTKVEAAMHQAIGGKLGHFLRTPTRALTAADEFWKTLLSSAEMRQIAYRQAKRETSDPDAFRARYESLLLSPTEAMTKQAQASARYYTFQRELGPVGRGVQLISNNSVIGKILLPFVRTPSNIIKFAGERSAFGLAMPEVRAALKAGGRSRDEALAKITLGSGLSTAAVVAAMDGRISGSGPTDPQERAALLQSGWQPNSIRVGDQWVSYSRFDPVSTLVGVAADFAEAAHWASEKEADSIALNLAMGIAKNITNKTWLSGLSDAFDVLSDPDRYGKGYVQKLAGSLAVPAISSQTAQALDPHLRDARTVMDAIKARVPVLSQSVPVRRNVWGEPAEKGDAIGPDVVSPFFATQAKSDPLSREIARLRAPLPRTPRAINVDGTRTNLTAKQYDAYVQLAGQPAKRYLESYIGTPEWKELTDDERRDEVKSTLEEFRGSARIELKKRFPELGGKGDDDFTPPPPPPGFEPAR